MQEEKNMGLFMGFGKGKKYKTKDKKISLVVEGYQKVAKNTPYDLQLTNEKSYISVFSYDINSFGEGTTPIDILYRTIEDLMSRRTKVKLVAGQKKIEDNQRVIHQIVYTGVSSGTENVYCFNIIEFDENAERFAMVLFTCLAPYREEKVDEFTEILKTAEVRGR